MLWRPGETTVLSQEQFIFIFIKVIFLWFSLESDRHADRDLFWKTFILKHMTLNPCALLGNILLELTKESCLWFLLESKTRAGKGPYVLQPSSHPTSCVFSVFHMCWPVPFTSICIFCCVFRDNVWRCLRESKLIRYEWYAWLIFSKYIVTMKKKLSLNFNLPLGEANTLSSWSFCSSSESPSPLPKCLYNHGCLHVLFNSKCFNLMVIFTLEKNQNSLVPVRRIRQLGTHHNDHSLHSVGHRWAATFTVISSPWRARPDLLQKW